MSKPKSSRSPTSSKTNTASSTNMKPGKPCNVTPSTFPILPNPFLRARSLCPPPPEPLPPNFSPARPSRRSPTTHEPPTIHKLRIL